MVHDVGGHRGQAAVAGALLTRRAVAAGDLLELQRIAAAGHEPAAAQLERLLRK